MDWDARNEAGLDPFMPAIDKLLAVDTLEEMTDYLLSDEYFCWGNPLCDISLQKNAEDSSLYEVQIAPTPLSLEDADEYGELSPYGEGLQQANNEMVRYMLSRIGWEDEADDIIRDSAALRYTARRRHVPGTGRPDCRVVKSRKIGRARGRGKISAWRRSSRHRPQKKRK